MRIANLKKILVATLICVLPLLAATEKHIPLSFGWDLVYGGANLTKDANIISILQFLCPFVFFSYLFSDFFCGELHNRLPYVLTRTSRRVEWFLKKTTYLLGWTVLFAYLHGLCLLAVTWIRQAPMDFQNFGKLQMLSFLMFILHSFTLAWITGIAALKCDPVKVTIGLLLLHAGIFSIVFFYAGQTAPQFLRFLPLPQFLLYWHPLEWADYSVVFSVPGLSFSYTAAYLLLIWAAVLAVSVLIIRRLDIL